MTKLLRPKDIQAYFNCSKDTSYKIIKLASFPCTRIGKNYYVQEDAMIKWLQENKNTEILL